MTPWPSWLILCRILSSISATPGGLRIGLPTVPGREVGIEYSSDLSLGSWIDLGNAFQIERSELAFLDSDPARKSLAAGYYRAFLRPVVE